MYTGLLQVGAIIFIAGGLFLLTYYKMKHPHTEEYKQELKRQKRQRSVFRKAG